MEEFDNHNCETSLWMSYVFTKNILWAGRWEGGSGWETHVHPWQLHVNVWQNQYNTVW